MTHTFPTRRSSGLHRSVAVDPVLQIVAGDGEAGALQRLHRFEKGEIFVRLVGRQAGERIEDPRLVTEPLLTGEGEVDAVIGRALGDQRLGGRSEEHTSELQSLMRISYAVFS